MMVLRRAECRRLERGVRLRHITRQREQQLLIEQLGPKLRAIEIGRSGVRRQVALVHRGEAFLTAAARTMRTLIVEALATRRARPR